VSVRKRFSQSELRHCDSPLFNKRCVKPENLSIKGDVVGHLKEKREIAIFRFIYFTRSKRREIAILSVYIIHQEFRARNELTQSLWLSYTSVVAARC
jgi:hypothetical protein